jgi:hypothetical protein
VATLRLRLQPCTHSSKQPIPNTCPGCMLSMILIVVCLLVGWLLIAIHCSVANREPLVPPLTPEQ